METARWIDMIDPVYTLVRIAGLDPELINITSIFIGDQMLIVRYLDDFQPHLILVPKTRGSTKSKNSPEFFITEILKLCNANGTKRLHFTHYSFIGNKFPSKEITSILNILLNPLTYQTLDEFYFEIDSRHLRELEDLMRPNQTIV